MKRLTFHLKKFAIVIILCLAAAAAFGQARPTLAILPFTGGSGEDGETIAELFSFDRTLNGAFTPIPRTSINAAIQKEQNFQMASGMTDPETISRIGKQLGAKYIVAGSITRLGSQQLLVIAIMQIENLQQIAGEWLAYQNISEVRGKLPEMAKNIVAASRNNTSRLQKLAVLPFQMPSGDREADALAQILAAEIIRTGTYAVFPRTKTLEQVQAEYKTQLSGVTDDYSIAAIGHGDNPLLALSGAARRLGQDRMFNAAIINVESGAQVKGGSADYQVIEDGLKVMRELAEKLMPPMSDFKVGNLQALLKAVDNINEQGEGNYTITLTGNITVSDNDQFIRFTENAKKTITLQGDSRERSLTSHQEHMPILNVPTNITLILGGNLRLSHNSWVGISVYGTLLMENGTTIANCRNSGVIVYISGTFTMNGGTISGNTASVSGGGVKMWGGTFTMNGGTISGNYHGGVDGGTFTMNGGTISGNRESGVYVSKTFTMNGGTISDNTSNYGGGGVFVPTGGIFIMHGGSISGNTSSGNTSTSSVTGGGGVWVNGGTFTMTGGTINSNTTRGSGGGVYVSGTFVKTGGTIAADNKATEKNGGNAVYVSGGLKRNSTAGPSVNLDSHVAGRAGGWE